MNDTPKIRFNEFTDEWEQRKLGEIATEINRNDPESTAPIMMITANNGFIEQSERYAFNNAGESLKRYILLEKGELAYNHGASKLRPYGSCFALTTVESARIPFVYHCFSVGENDSEFVSIELNGTRIEGQLRRIVSSGARMDGLLNISFAEYGNVELMLPNIDEQKQLSAFFRSLDNLITLHQRKYEQMINVKKSMLGRLFPHNGAKNPQIRFGFSEDWDEVKLGDIVFPYSDPVETPHDGYTRLGIRSHGKGTFHDYVQAGQELETAQMHRVAAHKFIVNITFGWEHAVAITNEQDAGKLVSHRFPQFSMTDSVDDSFLKYVILDERFKHHLFLSSPGGAGRNRVLNIPQMLEYKMRIPKIEEQRQIAGLLDSVNNLIDLYAGKVQKLKQIKSACLDKMFI